MKSSFAKDKTMDGQLKIRDARVSTMPEDFARNQKLVSRILADINRIYRRKAQLVMSRFSRGSVLIQNGKVLTDEMVEEKLHKRR